MIWILDASSADGNLAEATGQQGYMVDAVLPKPKPSQSNPGLRADETPCSHVLRKCSADQKLAEAVGQLGNMVEFQIQVNPSPTQVSGQMKHPVQGGPTGF